MAYNTLIEQYRANRKITDPKFLKLVRSGFLFNMFLLGKLPMGFIARLKVKSVDAEQCQITVPFRWVNQNPFGSTYFAVLAMAAEMSSGMLALMATQDSKPSVSMLVTKLEAKFVKKAMGLTTFTCNDGAIINAAAEKAIATGEGQSVVCSCVGKSESGEIEAEFLVEWSFKARSKK
jgi:hypothetical protein